MRVVGKKGKVRGSHHDFVHNVMMVVEVVKGKKSFYDLLSNFDKFVIACQKDPHTQPNSR